MTTYYKIVEFDKKTNKLKALFHGIQGSRIFEPGVEYIADKKIVDDGGTKYLSGFHVLPTLAECEKYLLRFKRVINKKIVACECTGMRPKAHSPSNVLLADTLKVIGVAKSCYWHKYKWPDNKTSIAVLHQGAPGKNCRVVGDAYVTKHK
jgi:hypothetical protein